MSTTRVSKAWYLLLAVKISLRPRDEPPFVALPCETLDDLAAQLALHGRCAPRVSN